MTKRYILTGGSGSLGKEFATICLEKDVKIICLDQKQPDYACTYIHVDFLEQQSIQQAAALIKNMHKEFDALINCSGVISFEKTDQINYDEIQRVHAINVIAPIFLTSQLLNLIKKNEADILNIGSTAGLYAYPDYMAYGTSKWAVRGMSQNFRLALEKTKCRVIHFNPGGFKSKLFENASGQEDMNGYMDPRDIADIMFYTLNLPKSVEVSEILINRK